MCHLHNPLALAMAGAAAVILAGSMLLIVFACLAMLSTLALPEDLKGDLPTL
jgi:hypothetical protein